jgi:hypothetical protein
LAYLPSADETEKCNDAGIGGHSIGSLASQDGSTLVTKAANCGPLIVIKLTARFAAVNCGRSNPRRCLHTSMAANDKNSNSLAGSGIYEEISKM